MASTDDGQGVSMNAMADITTVHRLARKLEDSEAKRRGVRLREARPHVARRLGVSPGTLENIRRLRTKVVPNWVMARVRAAFVAELQAEIQRLEHEVAIHLQIGSDPRCDDLAKAQAQVDAARALLTGRPA